MIKTKYIILPAIFLACLIGTQAKISWAATPTASPSASVEPTSEDTTKAILNRINKQLSEEQEAQLNQAITTLSQYRRGILGTIERVNDEAISIKHAKGTLIVPVTGALSILQDNKAVKRSELTVGTSMLATGALTKPEDINTLVASKLEIFAKTPEPLPISVTLGTLKSITNVKADVISRSGEKTLTYTINKNTKIQTSDGSATTVSKLNTDTTVLVIGYTKENTLFATTIRSLAQ